ncbi:8-amino-7-oxononanoate synthase [Paenibacillus tarimensis]
MTAWIDDELDALKRQSLERTLRSCEAARGADGRDDDGSLTAPGAEDNLDNRQTSAAGAYLIRDRRRLLNLASNNYLGLAGDERIREAMIRALEGEAAIAGAGASRLITGNYPAYAELEHQIAEWKEAEAALVFPNGYMANAGIIPALVGRGDAVFSDRLNHASIVDGIVLSRAEHYRYRHNDMEHLRHLLHKHGNAKRKLIVTDTVFSMDGDAAPLLELVKLRNDYGAMLMTDEAHAGGVYGPSGAGLCQSLGLHHSIDVRMGTFSKAFGVYGAYVCGSHSLIRYLVNKSRTLIFTTGLPPAVIAGIGQALELVRHEGWRRQAVLARSRDFRLRLRHAGFQVPAGDSPIIPLLIGTNEAARNFGAKLAIEGIAAGMIRPPTVPAGTARIRFSLTALHTESMLERACAAIEQIGKQLGAVR